MKRILITVFLVSVAMYAKETYNSNNKIKNSNISVKSSEKKGDKELIKDLSKNIRPQDDFYKYVNETWEKKTKLPETKPAWGAFVELSEENQKFLKNLIKNLKKDKNIKTNSNEEKILTLYDSYINVKKRDKEGIAPIQKELEKINNLKNIEDFERFNIEITKDGGSAFYGWGVGTDLNDSKNNAVYLGNASIGLSRDYYQKETEENKVIIEEYKKYVKDMLLYLNEGYTDEELNKKVENIVNFEKEIAKTLLTNEERHDVKKYNNPRTIEELAKISKNVDLPKYLKEVGVNTPKVLITEIKFFENLDKFVNNSNIETIKDYMKFHLITGAAGFLSEKIGERRFEFYTKYLRGQKERESLTKRALYFVDGTLGEMVSKIYVEEKFSPEAKKYTQEMVDYIIKAFRNRVKKLDWMSAQTKEKALEKLEKFTVKIGYPDKWEDYSTLVINKNDSLYNQMESISKWLYKKELEKVGKPVDKTEWFMNAHEVNAYYSPTQNEIVFPAGILQYPFYSYEKSGVGANFGGIGAVIGHELTHGFDVSGANFDGDGNVADWWTKEDKEKFEKVTKKLEEEYSSYSVSENININGKFTLTENIADLGGVNIAYDALQLYLQDHPEKNVKVEGFSQDELFFFNYARIWHQKATQEYLNNLVKTDSHSPTYFRVNGVLKNVDAFHNIFNTGENDKLYKSPSERIKIW